MLLEKKKQEMSFICITLNHITVTQYPPINVYIATENGIYIIVELSKVVMFYCYVNVYQRVFLDYLLFIG